MDKPKTPIEKLLRSRISKLDEVQREHSDVSRALQAGEVDAVVVLQKGGASVYRVRSDEPLYRAMLEELPHGAATLLPDSTVVYANRHLVGMTGKEGDTLLGNDLLRYVAPSDRDAFLTMLHRAIKSPQEMEVSFEWPSGTAIVLVSANRLPIEEVEVLGVAFVDLRDQVARRAAEEASRAKDDLLAAVSHELRTPLASMMGWVQLLELELAGDARVGDALQNLKNAVQAESAIVEDLVDLSRSEHGSIPVAPTIFDVRDAVKTAATFVTHQAGNKSLELQIELPDEPLPFHGDADRLRQVFVNLLSNAIKFTERNGKVHVSVTRSDGAVRVDVTDSGMGISSEFLPFVFEPFRRADGVRDHPGLGIGLAIAKRLVEAHGGAISAASEGLGRGATFRVLLPLGDH